MKLKWWTTVPSGALFMLPKLVMCLPDLSELPSPSLLQIESYEAGGTASDRNDSKEADTSVALCGKLRLGHCENDGL